MHQDSDPRRYPDRPIVGVGGIIFDGDNILLVKRAKDPSAGAWSLPGGAQELGETLKAAVIREIAEETGLDIQLGGLVDVIDFIDQGENGKPRHHYSLIDYWGSASGQPRAGSDVTEAVWVRPGDLGRYDLPDKTVEIIKKAHILSSAGRKQTLGGHLRIAAYAVLFGLGAYGILYILMMALRAIGFQDY